LRGDLGILFQDLNSAGRRDAFCSAALLVTIETHNCFSPEGAAEMTTAGAERVHAGWRIFFHYETRPARLGQAGNVSGLAA
jgi:hypothetical protein